MFDLQQKYKNISQDAKTANKFIWDTTALHRTECNLSCKEHKGIYPPYSGNENNLYEVTKKEKNKRLQHSSVDSAFKNYVKNLGYICPSCVCVPFGPRSQYLVAGCCLLFGKIGVVSWQGLEPQYFCSFLKGKTFLLLQLRTILAQFNF